MLRPGDAFGRYTIESLLGEGGMGTIFLARDGRLNRRVALKLVRVQKGVTEAKAREATARLLREARAAATLQHPNAVAIYDVGEVDGAEFIAMEYVRGKTLRARLDEGLPWKTRLRWLVEVARALDAAHEAGLVHRDIKPENVMVRDDGMVKVLDFGIARHSSAPLDPTAETAPEALATITGEGVTVGTPLYMSPEQIRHEPLDGRSDQFAWGVLAYELLTGHTPWTSCTVTRVAGAGDQTTPTPAMTVIAAILSREPEPIRATVPEVPAEVEAVVLRALRKEASARMESMADLVEALEPLLSDSLVGAPTTPKRQAQTAAVTRHGSAAGVKRLVAGLAVVLLGLTASLVAIGALMRARLEDPAKHSPISEASTAPVASASGEEERGIAVTDLPLPSSAVPEALAAYKAGMQALRDGLMSSSLDYFEKARKLDPTMSAAFFRGFDAWLTDDSASAVELFRQAVDRRADLGEHEALLLDAISPCVRHDAGADRHCVERVRALTKRFPRDAEFAMVLAIQLNVAGRMAESHAAAARATELDPKFGEAWAWLAASSVYLGHFDDARREYVAGAQGSPCADCYAGQGYVAIQLGRADEVEAAANAMLNLNPNSNVGLGLLTNAYGCLDRPEPTLRAAVGRIVAAQPQADRELVRLLHEYWLAIHRGDFASAARSLEERRPVVARRRDISSHYDFVLHTIRVAEETGQAEAAEQAAHAYLEARESLVAIPSDDDAALAKEGFGPPLRALRRGGKMTKAELRAERDRWVARLEPKLGPDYRPFLWLEAYASTVDDADDAREALEALPRFGGLPKNLGLMNDADLIGRVYLLADRVDDAIPWLERGAHACWAYSQKPIWSSLLLGQAREKKGDKAGACDAYAFVLHRWGNAKPKSVTADEARKRSRDLGCAR